MLILGRPCSALWSASSSAWSTACMVRFVGVNPVITTIATLSVLQGFALYCRPSPGGVISEEFTDAPADPRSASCRSRSSSSSRLPSSATSGSTGTRSGLRLRAVGFREEAAKRNGVRINFVHLRAYLLSGRAGDLRRLLPRLRSRRRPPDGRFELHADQHRRRGARRRGAHRRARLVRRRGARRAVLHADRQHHHAPRAEHRRSASSSAAR